VSGDPPIDILLVDDQAIVAEGVRRLLAGRLAARVHHHAACAGAIEAAVRLHPDVILQDVLLPDGDGVAMIARYRAEAALADVPIVVLSGLDEPARKAGAFAAGASDYLVKLPSAEELAARIRHHAGAARAARARDAALVRAVEAEQALLDRNRELDDLNRLLATANEAIAGDARSQRERLAAARRLGEELLHIHDVDLLFDRILAEADAVAGFAASALFVRTGPEPRYRVEAGRGADGRDVAPLVVGEEGPGLVASAAREGREIRRDDRAGDVPLEAPIAEALGCTPRFALSLPLRDPGPGAPVLAVLLVLDPRDPDGRSRPFTDEEDRQLRHVAALATLALERARLTRSMVLRMVRMAELRDPTETGAHVQRVAGYSLAIFDAWANARAMPDDERRRLRDRLQIAALLHDVGKVGVADAILGKPGPLDAEERSAMERHTEIGGSLFGLFRSEFDEAARDVALGHHERWDGRGYPGETNGAGERRGRSGEEIPLFARIVAIADVYDALTSRRPYKEPWPEEKVIAHLEAEAGRHFDPELVAHALAHAAEFRRIRERIEARDEKG
jgi:response regulator RpfG family c-di-GMP phosphodiesterase